MPLNHHRHYTHTPYRKHPASHHVIAAPPPPPPHHATAAEKLLTRKARLMAADLYLQLHILGPSLAAPLSTHLAALARDVDMLARPGRARGARTPHAAFSGVRATLRDLKPDTSDASRFAQARVHNVLDAFDDVAHAASPASSGRVPPLLAVSDVAAFGRSLEALAAVRATRDLLRRALDVDHACTRACRLLRAAREEAALGLRAGLPHGDEVRGALVARGMPPPAPSAGMVGVRAAHDALRDWTTCLWDLPDALRVARSAMSELRAMRTATHGPAGQLVAGLDALPHPSALQDACRAKVCGRVRGLVKSVSRRRISKRGHGSGKRREG